MSHMLQVTLRDGLRMPMGYISPASYQCEIHCRVPDDWLNAGSLRPEKQELLLQKMYGPTWRNGNEDGSQYVVLNIVAKPLTAELEQAGTWRVLKNNTESRFWFWRVDNTGAVVDAKADEL